MIFDVTAFTRWYRRTGRPKLVTADLNIVQRFDPTSHKPGPVFLTLMTGVGKVDSTFSIELSPDQAYLLAGMLNDMKKPICAYGMAYEPDEKCPHCNPKKKSKKEKS